MANARTSRILALFLSDALYGILGILTLSLLARVLSQADLANYLQVFLIFNTLLPILAFGLPDSIYSLVPRNLSRLPQFFFENQVLLFSIGALSFISMHLESQEIASKFLKNPEASTLVEALAFSFIISLPLLSIPPFLISLKKTRMIIAYSISSRMVIFASTILPAVFTHSALNALIGFGIGNLLTYAIVLGLLSKTSLLSFAPDASTFSSLRTQVYLGFPLLLSTSFGAIQTQLDRWLISILGSLAEFTRYALIVNLISLISNITNPISKVLMSDLSTLFLTKRYEEAGRLIWRTLEINLSFLLPITLICIFSAESLLTLLYSETYRECAIGLQIAAFLLPTRALTFSSIEIAAGKSKFVPMVFGMNMAITIILSLLLYKKFGYLSILYANLITAYAFSIPAHLFIFLKYLHVPLRKVLPFPSLVKVFTYCLLPLPILAWPHLMGWKFVIPVLGYLMALWILFVLLPGESPWKSVLAALRCRGQI